MSMSIGNTGMGLAILRGAQTLGGRIASGGLHKELATRAFQHELDTRATLLQGAVDMAGARQRAALDEKKAKNDHNRTINRNKAESLIRQQELEYARTHGQPGSKVQHGNFNFTLRDNPTSGSGVKITATPDELAAAVKAHVNLTRRKNVSPTTVQRSRDRLVALHGYDFNMADQAVKNHIKKNPVTPPKPKPVP
jgi:hypothetical protein